MPKYMDPSEFDPEVAKQIAREMYTNPTRITPKDYEQRYNRIYGEGALEKDQTFGLFPEEAREGNASPSDLLSPYQQRRGEKDRDYIWRMQNPETLAILNRTIAQLNERETGLNRSRTHRRQAREEGADYADAVEKLYDNIARLDRKGKSGGIHRTGEYIALGDQVPGISEESEKKSKSIWQRLFGGNEAAEEISTQEGKVIDALHSRLDELIYGDQLIDQVERYEIGGMGISKQERKNVERFYKQNPDIKQQIDQFMEQQPGYGETAIRQRDDEEPPQAAGGRGAGTPPPTPPSSPPPQKDRGGKKGGGSKGSSTSQHRTTDEMSQYELDNMPDAEHHKGLNNIEAVIKNIDFVGTPIPDSTATHDPFALGRHPLPFVNSRSPRTK